MNKSKLFLRTRQEIVINFGAIIYMTSKYAFLRLYVARIISLLKKANLNLLYNNPRQAVGFMKIIN